MRFTLLLMFGFTLLGFATLAVPQKAHAFFDFLFPTPDLEAGPAETLRAPFASEDDVIFDMDSQGNELSITPLDQRHRTNKAITDWLQEIVPALLTYNPQGYVRDIKKISVNFTKVGEQEYLAFLRDSNIAKTLETGRYSVTGVIKEYPIVMNEGAIDGRYRWLYQTTVMVTYFDQSAAGDDIYDNDSTTVQAITKEYVLTFQIGRYRESPNEHGIYFESWSSKMVRN